MALSKEVRLLQNKWLSGQGWPKRLEWLEIEGLRGWSGQRVDFQFPIVALVGENGVGKSTVLQAAAAVYQPQDEKEEPLNRFASDFFPDTAWECITSASIRFSVRQGMNSMGSSVSSIRKPSGRWRGNPERPKRYVIYSDLARVQPIPTRVGYARLAKGQLKEATFDPFDNKTLLRLSNILAKKYDMAKFAMTENDTTRAVTVFARDGSMYSGFHQGSGETGIAELLKSKLPKYSIVLIDEIEASLHPRAQRRLLRDLAQISRELDIQFVITTHSPYILSELPPEARIYLMDGAGGRQVIAGVSPEFAMTKLDDEAHPELDIYVEDVRSAALLREIIIKVDRDLVSRVQFIPFGTASVGRALGQMVNGNRFPRPSSVFLDGDQELAPGCDLLPGGDAPERVVFEGLQFVDWHQVYDRVGRSPSEVIDACSSAMTLNDHHDWVKYAADRLVLGGDLLWQALCYQWSQACLDEDEAAKYVELIQRKVDSGTSLAPLSIARKLPF